MYLKSLTLKGFKSFADRAHMVFEPGLTVIVGPNGSGKSNVSDAIRWVLGEQSAKQLRGQAMEDVVFAGSSDRKPVSVAEVDLTLDNSDHVLPVDFEEVVITRRMYRTGESEYLINGSPARLLDITDILHDTGLGKDTHSIIGQGKLDSILASKPEERRMLIEEAAGISKHKRRRERSVKKLESMETHLQRALDVQKEVNRQLKPLARQVEKAKRVSELADRARQLRVCLAVDDLRRLQVKWAEVERREVECVSALDLARARVEERNAELEHLRNLLEEKGVFAGDLSEQRRRAQSCVEKTESLIRLLEEKDRAMGARRMQLSTMLEGDEARSAQIREEIRRSRVEYDEAAAAVDALREQLCDAKAEVDVARKARRKADDELEKVKSEQRSTMRERDAAAVALAKAQDMVKNAQIQEDIFSRRLDQIDESTSQSQAALDEVSARRSTLESALATSKEAQALALSEYESAKQRASTARSELAAAQKELAEVRARIDALKVSIRQDEGSAPLAGCLARSNAVAGQAVRAAETLIVPERLESLVECLLSEDALGFVVGDLGDFVELGRGAQDLSSTSSGAVSVVNADGAAREHVSNAPGYRLLDHVSARPGFEGAAEILLGDVWVVESVEAACKASQSIPSLRFVTEDGACASNGGLLRVGRPEGSARGLLERRRLLQELQARLPEIDERVGASTALCASLEDEVAAARDRHASLGAESARCSGELRSLGGEVARLEQLLRRNSSERDSVCSQRDEGRSKSEKAYVELQRHQGRLECLNALISDFQDRRMVLEEDFDKIRREERRAHEAANLVQLEHARMLERSRSLDRGNTRLEAEGVELEGRIANTREELAGLKASMSRVQPLHDVLLESLQQSRRLSVSVSERASLAEADSAEIKATIEAARQAVADAEAMRSRAMSTLSDVRVQKGRLEVQVDSAVKAIAAQPGVSLEDALEIPAPQDRDSDERELRGLDRELAEIGPVNQVAFEEYEALKSRAEYLDSQIEDLQHARTDLRKILSAIDKKMREGFLEAFNAVNENFREIFGMLFPGGSGYIEMTNPDDPATTGIEVAAQPRGKRVSKMSLLSGGERSLTALGLLFSVYKTRSVPFYVLDEVEAALDDSNLDRLLGAFDQLRDTTQLIVISHQRRTMESADVLYGVSMRSDGVSRVISQKLERK